MCATQAVKTTTEGCNQGTAADDTHKILSNLEATHLCKVPKSVLVERFFHPSVLDLNRVPGFLSFRFLLLRHGYLLLGVYTLLVSLGLPIPVDPLFLLMGAMVGNHRYSFFPALMGALIPAICGDIVWYHIGRFRGRSVLNLLCKLSLEPDTCVRKTEAAFAARGDKALLIVKFVPGMSLVSVTLAGISKMPFTRFLLADAAGCAIWVSVYLTLGNLFYRQVDKIIQWLGLLGRQAGLVIFILLMIYLAYKSIQRWRFIRGLRVDRITPQEAHGLLNGGQPVTIVDLRHPAEVERVGTKIAKALVLRPDELRSRSHEIPKDQEIILYCT